MGMIKQYNLHNIEIPRWLREKYETEKTWLDDNAWSRTELDLYNLVKEYYPNARNWVYIDGFECDVVVEGDRPMIISYDWYEFHRWKTRRKDKQRSQYFRNRARVNWKQSFDYYPIKSSKNDLERWLLWVLNNIRK